MKHQTFPAFLLQLPYVHAIGTEDGDAALANFNTFRQLALDLNQPAAFRELHRAESLVWAGYLFTAYDVAWV